MGEKEDIENMLSIVAEGSPIEESVFGCVSVWVQGDVEGMMMEMETWCLKPLENTNPHPSPHINATTLDFVYPEMMFLSEEEGVGSEEDYNNVYVAKFIAARSGGTTYKMSVLKRPTIRQQKKVALENVLKENKEKKKRRRLVKSRLVDEKDLPPANIVEVEDEEVNEEPASLVRKSSKKNVKQKKVSPVKVLETELGRMSLAVQQGERVHKKALLTEYQLMLEMVNKVLLPRAERQSIASIADLVLLEALDGYTAIKLPGILIENMKKEIRRLKAQNTILEVKLSQASAELASSSAQEAEVACLTVENESKNIATLMLDELIGNLTAYELRSQTIKMDASKKERSMALRIAEGADLEEDEMAMITRNFKKYLIREIEWKKERAERRNVKKEYVHPKKNKGSTKAMVASWRESSDEDLEDEDGDEQEFMAIGESDEESEVSIIHLKDKIKFLSKERLSELLLDFIDEYEDLNNEKEQLSKECVILKAKCKNLELRASERDSKNAELKNQVHELDTTVLELRSKNLKLKLGTRKKEDDHTQLTLEENVGKMKDELYKRDARIRVLKEDLSKVNYELDRTCTWNMSSDALLCLQ
ncbi:uncharacterized protein [Nicotiana sylvestris]|uniref:uncharacterized protein n=1 Tax=Nicotiana sylvestris TaxID=4096 RepID=UPI00388C4931